MYQFEKREGGSAISQSQIRSFWVVEAHFFFFFFEAHFLRTDMFPPLFLPLYLFWLKEHKDMPLREPAVVWEKRGPRLEWDLVLCNWEARSVE